MNRVKIIFILLAIVTVSIILRVYCIRGFSGFDEAEYAKCAFQVANGNFDAVNYSGPAVFPLRVGVIYPTAFIFRFFGVSEWGMISFPFALSILSVLLAYWCASMFFGQEAGLIAAALWAVLPADIEYNATKLLPDLPGAFFSFLAVVIISAMIIKKREKYVCLVGGIIAGISFGISWLCKETVLYLIPFCLILFIFDAKERRENAFPLWVGVALGSIGVLLAEMAIYHGATGDWVYRFHEMERNYRQWPNGFFTEGSKYGWSVGENHHVALIKRLFLAGPEIIFLNHKFLYLPLFGFIGSVYAYYWKNGNFKVPSIWLASICLMFNFASSSLSSYTPLALFNRYMYQIHMPAIVVTAGFLVLLLSNKQELPSEQRRERRFWGITMALLIMLCAGYQSFRQISDHGNVAAWMIEVRKVSSMVPEGKRIYTDPIGKRGLEFFRKYVDEGIILDFEGIGENKIPKGSYVLTNKVYMRWLDINAGMWPSGIPEYKKPDFIVHSPETWRVIWQNGNSTLYSVQ